MRNNTVLNQLNEETLSLDRSPNNPVLDTNAYTIALYKTVTNLIYDDVVNVSTTRTRLASVNCWEQLDADGNLIQNTTATYSGKFGTIEREILKENGKVYPDNNIYMKGDYFLFDTTVFQAVSDYPFLQSTGSDDDNISDAIFDNKIRYVSEPSLKEGFPPSETSFRLRSWRGNVGTRRTVLEITTEASHDLGKIMDVDAERTIIDTVASTIADDINKDITHTLVNVSKRYQVLNGDSLLPSNFADLSASTDSQYILGRELYAIVSDMIAVITSETKYTPNYVITSPRVAGLINSSGMSEAYEKNADGKKDKYVLNDGTIMRVDSTTKFDYIVVGVKTDNASSLYLSNFVQDVTIQDGDKTVGSMELGTFNIIKAIDPKSMSDRYLCMARYALTTPPYTFSGEDASKDGIVYGDDWENLAGKSQLSRFIGIKLPEIYKSK